MDKKYVQVIGMILFAAFLTGYALIDVSTAYEEMAEVQDASRNLRRVDNIQYSYTTTLTGGNITSTERVDVWGNQLTGEWVAEYYTTDEDGTRMILKSFCDGRNLYNYIEWNGDWEVQQFADTTMPSFEVVTSLTYGDADIAEIEQVKEESHTTIMVSLTEEYVDRLISQNYNEARTLYEGYTRAEPSETKQDSLQLGMARYEQIRIEDATNTFLIDGDDVLCGIEYAATLYAPEVIIDESGQQVLGEEKSILFRHLIEIRGYNREMILDKIEQCSSEII